MEQHLEGTHFHIHVKQLSQNTSSTGPIEEEYSLFRTLHALTKLKAALKIVILIGDGEVEAPQNWYQSWLAP